MTGREVVVIVRAGSVRLAPVDVRQWADLRGPSALLLLEFELTVDQVRAQLDALAQAWADAMVATVDAGVTAAGAQLLAHARAARVGLGERLAVNLPAIPW